MVFTDMPSEIVVVDMVSTTRNDTSAHRNTAPVKFKFVRSHGSFTFLARHFFIVLTHDQPENRILFIDFRICYGTCSPSFYKILSGGKNGGKWWQNGGKMVANGGKNGKYY